MQGATVYYLFPRFYKKILHLQWNRGIIIWMRKRSAQQI